MSLQTQAWEPKVLTLAHEAINTITPTEPQTIFNWTLLNQAYKHCKKITAYHSRSFYMASLLLPRHKQEAMWALYAFCRVTDDIVDEAHGDAEEALAAWRKLVLEPPGPNEDNLVAIAWADTRFRFAIPRLYVEQLIDGVERDLYQARWDNFPDLATYAYGVASTVGLMSMHITGFSGPEAIPYAVKLGVALQITNILRDVGQDWQAGRVYLPATELENFGLDETDLDAARIDDRWRAFMRFQIDRNRQLYKEAWPGIAMLNPDGRFAIASAAQFYQGILTEIEANDYNVFNRRAYVSTWGKLRKLPGIWWQCKQL